MLAKHACFAFHFFTADGAENDVGSHQKACAEVSLVPSPSKISKTAGRLAAVAAVVCAAGSVARAATYTWDVNGSAAGTGGAGNWDNSSPFWTPDGSTYTAWPNASGGTTTALFGGTAGIVTLAAPITVNAINFTAANYSITNTGSGSLTFNGSSPTINTGGYNVAFNMGVNTLSLAGGTNIYKTGVGTLTIANDQNGGGIPAGVTWNVSGGSLASTGLYNSAVAITSGRGLGVATNNVLTLNAGSLIFTVSGGNGYVGGAGNRSINVTSFGGAISDGGFAPGEATAGGLTISPTINVASGAGLNLVSSNVLEFDSGIIQGAGNVTVYGTGSAGNVELLSATNSYTGVTNISNGALTISTIANGGSNSSIGASSNSPANLILNGSGGTGNTLGAGASLVFTGSGINTTDRGLTLTGTSQINFNVSTAGAVPFVWRAGREQHGWACLQIWARHAGVHSCQHNQHADHHRGVSEHRRWNPAAGGDGTNRQRQLRQSASVTRSRLRRRIRP